MKRSVFLFTGMILVSVFLTGCASMNKTQKGAAIGTAGGAAAGEETPKYANDTEEGRAQNRRVEFLKTANEKMKEDAQKAAEGK